MSRIALMPEELANQIAAGEVVERPASVVKELVENSLDAGASRIDVDIEGGGLSLVRVTDDGSGMSPGDAELCLLRHATSKLRSADDLFHLETMGFRGEALASIASVSRLSLTTRSQEALAAYRILIEGGQKQSPSREVGGAVGTQFEVRDLFYNVPARLKFMKSESTESSHIAETILRLALAFPGVHFRLRQKGQGGLKIALDLPPNKSALERSRAALAARGKVVGPPLLFEGHAAVSGMAVEAHVGAPADSTAVPRNVFLLVNRRFVRDRSLLHAALSGYGELLEKGRYPLLVLHLTLDPATVDVNVHPQKLEVRLQQADAVYSLVREATRNVCSKAPWLRGVKLDEAAAPMAAAAGAERVYTVGAATPVLAEPRPAYGSPAPSSGSQAGSFSAPASSGQGGAGKPRAVEHQLPLSAFAPSTGLAEHRARLRQAVQLYAPAGEGGAPSADGDNPEDPSHTAPDPTSAGTFAPDLAAVAPGAASAMSDSAPSSLTASGSADLGTAPGGAGLPFLQLVQSTYLGQLYRTYLLCEQGDELLLIDQHAAHERVVFERLRAAHRQAPLAAQRLLFPVSLEFDARRVALIGEFSGELTSLGFELQPFGGRSFALLAAPDLGSYGRGAAGLRDPEALLRQVLDDLEEHGRSETLAARTDLLLATMACHSAVRAGDVLDEAKVRGLLSAMDEVHYSPYCPHGRPVLVRLSRGELERRFGRA